MTPSLVALPLAVWERDGLKAALTKAGLPADDIFTPGPQFWRFTTDDDVPAGFGGIEVHGADALMRSVVTLPPLRGRGVGQGIVRALEAEAIVMKCGAVWLLTTTAREFFGKLGYAAVDRADVPGAIRATAQFSSLCPDSATVMVRRLA
jgi:N-acetylglutamate synthase-like GNAT family acetyltransferase